jgi:hypothetical protein
MSYLTPGRHGLVQHQLNIPSAATKATGTVRKRQAVRPAHHIQNHTCWVTLLQKARRAAVLGQLSSLRPHWSSQLDEVWCDWKQGSKETILPMQMDFSSFFYILMLSLYILYRNLFPFPRYWMGGGGEGGRGLLGSIGR